MSVYSFDIDGIIAQTEGSDYPNSKPKPEAIKMINILYDKGHTIKIFTGRGSKSGKDWRVLTEAQLKEWGVKYHELIMGKPDADYFVDDKNISLAEIKGSSMSFLIKEFVTTYKAGGKILVCGNGGFAADSEHFVGELVGKFAYEVYLPALALTANSTLVTAIANDMGYENVFAHQVKALGQKGDIFVGMTTSQSKNIVKAQEVAQSKEMRTIIVCGQNSNVVADYMVRMDGNDTAQIQNNAIQFLHALAYAVKKEIWENKG